MFRRKRMIGFRVEVVIEPDTVGFHAYCPALKGVHTCGDTVEEASRNARDAVAAYLRASIMYGDPIPIGITRHDVEEGSDTGSEETAERHTEDVMLPCAI